MGRYPKEYKEIIDELVRNQGWSLDERGTHAKLYPPDKSHGLIPVPGTPGDRRSLRNFVAQVRRAGGIWPITR